MDSYPGTMRVKVLEIQVRLLVYVSLFDVAALFFDDQQNNNNQ